MSTERFEGLQERLDKLDWPAIYMFKFIVPAEKEDELASIFTNREIQKRFSRTGKYVSITSCYMLASGEEVIEMYKKASVIEGVVAL